MSVVVRMEMPINCLECPMYDWNRQKLCCNAHFDLRPIPNGGVPIPDWCPIICQLPEGHGPLVDAEKLKERSVHFCETEYTFDFDAVFVEEIDEAPTIVPAEAKRKVDAHDAVAPTDTPTDTPTVAAERSET